MLQPSSHFLCSENCRNNRYAFTAADALVLVLLHTLIWSEDRDPLCMESGRRLYLVLALQQW